ncbi:MAG TPA: DUF4440 domain-containing protein [Polyangiaceae bacterium]|jgi:hypothetical protein|nr:DUF4440 domain-containing protein [Polyangiaceae bacterium]
MVEDEIRQLEERLLTPQVRGSRAELERLIADEFLEFGSSGRAFTKAGIIAQLASQPHVAQPAILEHFNVRMLAPGVVLATYRLASSLRSSIWRHEAAGWRMLFHQGTPTGGKP